MLSIFSYAHLPSSLIECSFRSFAYFKNHFLNVCFLIAELKNCFFWIEVLHQTRLWQISSPIPWFVLILLTLSFAERIFHFNETQLINYVFHELSLWCYIWNLITIPRLVLFTVCFAYNSCADRAKCYILAEQIIDGNQDLALLTGPWMMPMLPDHTDHPLWVKF